MPNYFPSCKVSDDDASSCLNCEYSTCILDLVDKQIEINKNKQRNKEEQDKQEKKVFEELLQVRWENYHKHHPNEMDEVIYKTTQRAKLTYAKQYRERKKKSG